MLGKLGIDTVNPVTKRFNYGVENLAVKQRIIDGNGTRGTLSSDTGRVRGGPKPTDGNITFEPNAYEMAEILHWAFGGTPTGTGTVTYPLSDTAQTRYVTADRVQKVFTYDGVAIDQITFRGGQGATLMVDAMCVAKTETVANAGTFPSININDTTTPWIFEDLTLSVNSVTVLTKSFELQVQNFVDRQRFFNSLTLTDTLKHDRMVNFSCLLPFGDYSALYGASGGVGVGVTATFTNGSNILTFTMGKVHFPMLSPTTPERQEIMLPIRGQAFGNGSTKELVTTIAS